jgi:hypothetical protein
MQRPLSPQPLLAPRHETRMQLALLPGGSPEYFPPTSFETTPSPPSPRHAVDRPLYSPLPSHTYPYTSLCLPLLSTSLFSFLLGIHHHPSPAPYSEHAAPLPPHNFTTTPIRDTFPSKPTFTLLHYHYLTALAAGESDAPRGNCGVAGACACGSLLRVLPRGLP